MSLALDEASFRGRLERGLEHARRVLENERRPVLASEQEHRWDDKFGMAHVLTNVAVATAFNALEALGVNGRSGRTAREWAETRSVTLRLRGEERCELVREAKREVEAPTKHVADYGVGKIVDKVVTTVTDYHWRYTARWTLTLFPGNESDDGGALTLQTRQGACEVVTTNNKTAPRKEIVVRDALDLNVTWLLQQVERETWATAFRIARESPTCRTPRRNAEAEKAEDFFERLEAWCGRVERYFKDDVFSVHTTHGLDIGTCNAASVFVPVLPLFEALGERQRAQEEEEGAVAGATTLVGVRSRAGNSGPALGSVTAQRFVDEAKRTLGEKMGELAKAFPDAGDKLITAAEANVLVAVDHAREVAAYYRAGMEFIEELIRKALVAAVGREVTPSDFGKYMEYHNRKIFRSEYQPKAFSYAVRRPGFFPEGVVSIEMQRKSGATGAAEIAEPVQTVAARADVAGHMEFAIGAGAKVAFKGEAYVHGVVMHEFEGETGSKVWLSARARQFSSFLVLVGKLAGPGLFDPQYGMIVQNKDDVTIPLELETIPSAGEFKAATVSISPEMQAFAKMYRAMQLSSTLFAVCVLQIKPQMERVLRLTNESLTKEIRLTQDLLKLFIEYQIPSDMLSFGGAPDASKETRLAAVKSNVSLIQWTIDWEKFKQTEEVFKEAEKAAVERIANLRSGSVIRDLVSASGSLFSHRGVDVDRKALIERSFKGKGGPSKKSAPKTDDAPPADAPAEVPEVMEALAPPPEPAADDIPMEKDMDMDMDMDMKKEAKEEKSKEKMDMSEKKMKKKSMPLSRRREAPAKEKEKIMRKTHERKELYDPNAEEIRRIEQDIAARKRDVESKRQQLIQRKAALDAERAQLVTGDAQEIESMLRIEPYSGRDYTAIPTQLDTRLEELDKEGALRPTIINVGKQWTKRSQKNLLADMATTSVGPDQQKLDKNSCYDLLDALTRSGGLDVEGATLHVVIASTHIFDKSVFDTLVEDNVNPIDRMEKSEVIVATTIHGKSASEILKPTEAARIQKAHPEIFGNKEEERMLEVSL